MSSAGIFAWRGIPADRDRLPGEFGRGAEKIRAGNPEDMDRETGGQAMDSRGRNVV